MQEKQINLFIDSTPHFPTYIPLDNIFEMITAEIH